MNILKAIRIPDLFSLLNLALGFWAILAASRGNAELSVMLVIFSAVFDGLDGFLARRMKSSKLGAGLDSLADLVSFGVAPAVLVVTVHDFSGYALIVGLVYLICGTLRLARFNLSANNDKFFEGFPITASGMAVAASVILNRPELTLILMLVISVLMVSSVPYSKIREGRTLASSALVLIAAGMLFWLTRDPFLSGALILIAIVAYMASPVVMSFRPRER
jgi:archaetidylserine synthase